MKHSGLCPRCLVVDMAVTASENTTVLPQPTPRKYFDSCDFIPRVRRVAVHCLQHPAVSLQITGNIVALDIENVDQHLARPKHTCKHANTPTHTQEETAATAWISCGLETQSYHVTAVGVRALEGSNQAWSWTFGVSHLDYVLVHALALTRSYICILGVFLHQLLVREDLDNAPSQRHDSLVNSVPPPQ